MSTNNNSPKYRIRELQAEDINKFNENSIFFTERETFRRLIEDVYPNGVISIVSDTWDFWKVLNHILPSLKSKILSRNGKVVIRPDSGDPVRIICGYRVRNYGRTLEEVQSLMATQSGFTRVFDLHNNGNPYDCVKTSDEQYITIDGKVISEDESKGAIELLWELFGGQVNSKGFRDLDPHIGLIYGDSITLQRCERICSLLKEKGFASTNVVYGVGSYTYQYNTRDTFGLACKATFVVVDGEDREIFKDPITDDGSKKSACGLLSVHKVNGKLVLKDRCTREEEESGELVTVFENGKLLADYALAEIRNRLNENI